MPERRVVQCACGFVQGMRAGAELPPGWRMLVFGEPVCPSCVPKEVEAKRLLPATPANAPDTGVA